MRIVLITGSNSGIGLVTSLYLAKKGFFVYATMGDVSKKPKIFENYKNIKILKLDITKEEDIKNSIEIILKEKGRIDILINNASYGIWGALEDISLDEFKKLFETNFFGAFNLTSKILPIMRNQKNGLIINISSMGGRMAFPVSGAYNSTKFALEAYSEALRFEVAQFGIKVVLVEPGLIKTDFRNNIVDKTLTKNSHYKSIYNFVRNRHNRPTGSSPLVVARKIHKIIRTKNPGLRYLVGKHAKLYIIARTFMPNKLTEKLINYIISR